MTPRRTLPFLAIVLALAAVSAGCMETVTSALGGEREPDAPGNVVMQGADAVGPGFSKRYPLAVAEGHVRIVARFTLESTPAPPLPVQSPGSVNVTVRDPAGDVVRVVALGQPVAPPATPVYTATVDITGLKAGTYTFDAVGNGLGSGDNGARFVIKAAATANSQGDPLL